MTMTQKALSLLLSLLLAVSALAGQSFLTFGAPDDALSRVGSGFTNLQNLIVENVDPRDMGRHVLVNQAVLSQTGGGLLVSTAEPAPHLRGRKAWIRYVPSNPDGSRFQVTVGDKTALMSLFDWEAKPLVGFVESRHYGAINAELGSPSILIELDAAFQQSIMGLRFIQADLLPRNVIASQKYLPRNRSGVIFGGGERRRYGSEADAEAAMRELAPLFAVRTPSYSVLTDAGQPFVFSLRGNSFEIDGTPYYFWWNPQGGAVAPDEYLNREFRRAWPTLRRANPLVIGCVERAFRATAFFRYQQQDNPANWNEFARQVATIQAPTVPTPAVLVAPAAAR